MSIGKLLEKYSSIGGALEAYQRSITIVLERYCRSTKITGFGYQGRAGVLEVC